jgi:hypothetical protein
MKRKCHQCKEEFDGRSDAKFCCDSHRSTWNKQMSRMKATKIDFIKKLEEAKSLPSEYSPEVVELFNKLKSGGKYGV